MAVASMFIGLGMLGLILWRAVDVLAPRRFPLSALLDPTFTNTPTCRTIEHNLATMFPKAVGGYGEHVPGFAALKKVVAAVSARTKSSDLSVNRSAKAEMDIIGNALDFLVPAVTFEELRIRFLGVKRAVFFGGAATAAAFALYAWAANPPKEPSLFNKPLLRIIKIDLADAAILIRGGIDAKCLPSDLTVIGLRKWPSDALDVVTLPNATCLPIFLRLEGGRLSDPGY
jgi:hypothetical protein